MDKIHQNNLIVNNDNIVVEKCKVWRRKIVEKIVENEWKQDKIVHKIFD